MNLRGQPAVVTGYTKEQMWSAILEWTRFSDSIASREMHMLATIALDRIRSGLPELPPSVMSGLEAFKQTYLLETDIGRIVQEQA